MRGVWCVAMLAAGIAQGQERQPGQGVNFYSKEKEVALGRRLAQEFRSHTTPLDNAAVTDYVNRLGAKLAAHLPGDWTYQFETVREDTPGTMHEPAAFPGGFLFVSADLIAAARNEAEFAGMLAHSMVHVVERHGTRLATKTELMQIATQTAAQNNGGWTGASQPLGMLNFQRANEREADYLAVQAMAAAGFDPVGLASYIDRVQPAAPPQGAAFSPLPLRDQRVAAIQKEIRELLSGRTYQSTDEFERVQAEIKPR